MINEFCFIDKVRATEEMKLYLVFGRLVAAQ